jgi:hypothetical protein
VEWGESESLCDMTAMEGRCGAQVHACNDSDELCEVVHVVGSAPRRKHVVGQVIDVVHHATVGFQQCLDMTQRALDCVRMSSSTHINETDPEVDCLVCVCVAVRFDISVCRPAVTDDCSAGFDLVTCLAVLSEPGTRNVFFSDSHSTPPNTLWALLSLRRSNFSRRFRRSY